MHRRSPSRRLATFVAVAVTVTVATGAAIGASTPTDPGGGTTAPTTIEPPPDTAPPATSPPATDPPASEPPDTTTAPLTDPPAPTSGPAPTRPTTTTTQPAPPPTGLRILLTNDDGWDAEGITVVHAALVAAGHDVVIVAPATNQSGTGARVAYVGELTLAQPAEGVFSIDGSPADATELGLDMAFGGDRPDLVISGTNAGQNTGAVAVHSGTLGAAVTALNEGVPAIAVSTEHDLATGEGDFQGTAAFVVAVVGALADEAGDGPILPDGIGLSVNYPLVDGGGDPAGVAITTTDTTYVDIDHTEVSVPAVGEEMQITPGLVIVDPVDPDGDAARLAADFVTVTFIAGNYDVDPPATTDAVADLGSLLVDLAL